jgi:UDP-N-acetylglucosamine--N-acetylmuramyl-(pentapeptide) pyrophosphoryl-undecaprenol N-acetylglucosamine transferase
MAKIIITTGGSGGHIFPALTIAEQLQSRGHKVLFIGDARVLNFKKQIPKRIKYKIVASSSLGGGVIARVKALAKIMLGVVSSALIMLRYRPQLVVSFGGYPSFPTMVASILLRVPTLAHEQNLIMGKTSRAIVPWVTAVSVISNKIAGIADKHRAKLFVTANPVKAEILAIGSKGYPSSKTELRVLVLGGSQGAAILSEVVPFAVICLEPELRKKIRIEQQCREADVQAVQELYDLYGIKAKTAKFFDDVPDKLKQAHLVICRSGASTIAEVIAAKRAAIFVPLHNSADNHQFINTRELSHDKSAWVMEEKDFTAAALSALLTKLIKDPSILLKTAERMNGDSVDSGEKLVQLIEGMIIVSD